ncbi:MAG: molybdopterin-dependent oxidoreductase, partial [Candidatus Subteraquimicrobiales bacterium]|nr:molybdopterin-dependent oxidoreductase [Candidatus Subteraquimicrobiales bacterium]
VSIFVEALESLPTLSFEDLENANLILMVGTDASASVPALSVSVRKALKKGANLVVIDSRKTKEAEVSTLHLAPKLGKEGAVLRAIARTMLDKGLYNKDFVEGKISNLKEFKKFISESAKEIKEMGVSGKDIEKAAELYGELNKQAVIVFSPERSDSEIVSSVLNLLLLTGRIDKGLLPALLVANLRGAIELGAMPNYLPGYEPISEEGLSALEMLKEDSPILGMYILGGNPVVSFPEKKQAEDALSSLDFLVVQDIFLTETANLAHVVLPGLSFAETTGTVKNMEGKIKEFNPAIASTGKADWQIIVELAKEMGCSMKYPSENEIRKEIESSLSERKKGKKNDKFALNLTLERPAEKESKEFPFSLLTGASRFRFYDGIRSNKSKLAQLEPYEGNYVGINQADATSLSVKEGMEVVVSTKKGKIKARAKIDSSLPGRAIFMPANTKELEGLIEIKIDLRTKVRKVSVLAANVSLANTKKEEK